MTDLPIFVYGTLTSDEAHPLMADARRLGEATTTGTLWAMPQGYPALLASGAGRVYGELVAPLPAETLAALDAYEGVDEGLYERVVLLVDGPDGPVRAWAWVMHDPAARGGTLRSRGRWRETAASAPHGDAR